MKIYLASPFWQTEERANVERARDILRSRGFDVFVPMEHKLPGDQEMSNEEWGKGVFEMDREAMFDCDAVVALYYGLYSDSGTAWEIGFASCLKKKIVIVHCDKKHESSLMIVNGANINIGDIEELGTLNFENLYNKGFYSHVAQK